MSTNCLSSATNLRCADLQRGQNGIIFFPAVIQVMAIGGLSLRFWNFSSRKHYWLIADSWAYFILALLDLLSHQLNSARTSLRVFKAFDIVIGANSFIPILLYMLFLYILARSYGLPLLPRMVRKISKYALLVLIPVTIATNELGSFLGVNYRVMRDFKQQTYLAIGFSTPGNQVVWIFFTSVTLVVLIIFQAAIFSFSFYLSIRLWLESRQPAGSNRTSLGSVEIQTPRLKGVSWIAVGAKVGAVETLLGFVDGGFPVVLTRRILRMLSRVCLVYGVLKADSPRSLGREPSMSQIRGLISNPRASTFARLSPTATDFYSQQRANVLYGPRPMPQDNQGETQGADNRRVTVVYNGLAPPELNLRLSALGLPSPEVLTERFNKRGTMLPTKGGSNMSAGSSSTIPTLSAIAPTQRSSMIELPKELEPVARTRAISLGDSAIRDVPRSVSPRSNPKYVPEYWETGRYPLLQHSRFMSASSLASDSLSIVQELASQFPGIPPRQTLSGRYPSTYGERRPSVPALDQVEEETPSRKSSSESGHGHTQSQSLTPSNSLRRKAPPPMLEVQFTNPFEPVPTADEALDRSDSKKSDKSNESQTSSMRRKNAPPPIDPVIARADADGDLSRRIRVRSDSDRNTAYDNSLRMQAGSATPGMSYGTSSSRVTSPRTPPSNPFRDGLPEFALRDSDVVVNGGLSNIAARVAEFDRQKMASYRGFPAGTPPLPDASFITPEGSIRDKKGKSPVRMPPVAFPLRDSASISISSPRRLSAGTPRSRASSTTTMTDTAIESVRREHWKGGSLARIKSIGNVSSRKTPTPTPSTGSFTRQSMRVDEADFLDLSTSTRTSAVLVKPRPEVRERRKSHVAVVETVMTPGASTPRKLKKADHTVKDVESATYNRSYVERRIRRESEGEWEM